MSFTPKVLPTNASPKKIVDVLNVNFQLLAHAFNDINNRINALSEQTKKKGSVAGLSETLNFNGAGAGDVLTLTIVGGSVTGKTEV